MHVIVIGAGIVGTTTALALAERGLRVTLVERASEPAAGTSHANGSGFTPAHAEPWNGPGIVGKLLPALLRDDQPWRVRASALPGLLGWGMHFVRNSSPGRYYANTRHCARLAMYSKSCLVGLRKRHALDYHQFTRGSLELYQDAAALEQAIELRRRMDHPDIEMQTLDADALIALEPALAPVAKNYHGALLFPDHESGDARLFSRLMTERAAALGAETLFDTAVNAIFCERNRFKAVATDRGDLEADACIVAAGCGTRSLLAPPGLQVPIYPVKGYSATITLDDDDPAPLMPILDLKRRFVTASLGPDRLRIAGLAEFAGYNTGINPKRMQILLDGAALLLPRLADRIRNSAPNAWTGLRPMTPDGPPLIGATPIDGLHLNSGHGAMGWTQACGSAELVADLVTGNTPAIATDGLLAERWLGSKGE
ncbi:MAG: D-amino acid dehydrogenase [Wenzhouxiangellaceae bacterium]|nr:D-amino acid dehydrogenase [Wenzhouxiangellaceae bacterium]